MCIHWNIIMKGQEWLLLDSFVVTSTNIFGQHDTVPALRFAALHGDSVHLTR